MLFLYLRFVIGSDAWSADKAPVPHIIIYAISPSYLLQPYPPFLFRIDIIVLPLPAPHARQTLTPPSTTSPVLHLFNPRR